MLQYQINHNPLGIAPDELFAIGRRAGNPQRSFLFVSKLLGKHLAVRPEVVRHTGELLAGLPNDRPANSQPLVIGFSETATALGMAVAQAMPRSTYITTTREPIVHMPQLLSFEESHSHAPLHRLVSDTVQLDRFKHVMLVDDEITTGRSMLHIMQQLTLHSPVQRIDVLTILDWRDQESCDAFATFASKHGVQVAVTALATGQFSCNDHSVWQNQPLPAAPCNMPSTPLHMFPRRQVDTENGPVDYVAHSGRFGVTREQILALEPLAQEAAQHIAAQVSGQQLLVLGHGENIYIPSRVAAHLAAMGRDVRFRTTSRTPICVDGELIKDALTFTDRGVTYHFYNPGQAKRADAVIMLADTPFHARLCPNLIIFDL